ncbi:VanZ family protein [Cellulosimicrobium terreum]|nr:VanZ family protein [Cellulosimicrobium terreum]
MRMLTWTFAVYLGAVLVVTLWPSPQSTTAPGWATATLDVLRGLGVPMTLPVLEASANVVMFLPFGLLGVPLVHGRSRARRDVPGAAASPWRALVIVTLAGAALSTAIELTQHLLPGRVPTVQDVVLNTVGALLGGLLVTLLVLRRSGRGTTPRRRTPQGRPAP